MLLPPFCQQTEIQILDVYASPLWVQVNVSSILYIPFISWPILISLYISLSEIFRLPHTSVTFHSSFSLSLWWLSHLMIWNLLHRKLSSNHSQRIYHPLCTSQCFVSNSHIFWIVGVSVPKSKIALIFSHLSTSYHLCYIR